MIQPLLKPKDREGKITLTPRQRSQKLNELCELQAMMCCYCFVPMTRQPYHQNTATLEHLVPEPKGSAKRDNDDNLKASCWKCNSFKGSRRI